MTATVREFLESATLTRDMVDRFLDPDARNLTSFDAELGYKLRDSVVKDGVEGNYCTVLRFNPSGERTMLNFAGLPCRINTYGDSFTQCNQVSDGETWQEYLAAHFGEPVRNFGVGGYGVFQAYRRMLREEKTEGSAEYVILNIWSDDHFRSIARWPWLRYPDAKRELHQKPVTAGDIFMFHYVTWAHLWLNPATGEFDELENPYPTPESLYLLAETDHIYEAFKDDFMLNVVMAQRRAADVRTAVLQDTADALNVPADFHTPEATAKTASCPAYSCRFARPSRPVICTRPWIASGGQIVPFASSTSSVVAWAASRPSWVGGVPPWAHPGSASPSTSTARPGCARNSTGWVTRSRERGQPSETSGAVLVVFTDVLDTGPPA